MLFPADHKSPNEKCLFSQESISGEKRHSYRMSQNTALDGSHHTPQQNICTFFFPIILSLETHFIFNIHIVEYSYFCTTESIFVSIITSRVLFCFIQFLCVQMCLSLYIWSLCFFFVSFSVILPDFFDFDYIILSFLFWFLETVIFLSFGACPSTSSSNHADLRLTEVHLPLPHKCWY